uniref:Translocon-associated protein subunit alpha n=1 Tax=Romanomermis culicivorax TaxID=13658 RepID=A0A915L3G5_ROMCU
MDDDEGSVQVEDELVHKGPTGDKDLDPEEEVGKVISSPDVEAQLLFTDPPMTSKELTAGVLIRFLVGFLNRGEKPFTVESMDVSFRYPMDYSFYIRNFTDAFYNQIVAPNTEMSFDHMFFIPSEEFAGRPVGLSINLRYSDENKTMYFNNVFNETVNIIEDESGFNPETGFLYVIFACLIVLLLVLGQQFLSKMRKRHGMSKRSAPVEMGTNKNGNIDYDWIPRELLQKNKNSQGTVANK